MEADTHQVYMQNLEDYIFDENKIVTYKWLSSVLSLHINTSKLLLEEFIVTQKKKRPEVEFAVTHFISGVSKDKSGLVASIVDEKNISKFKESIDAILSQHVYSIQKSSTPTDQNALFLAGELDELCKGGIGNCTTSKRPQHELDNQRILAQPKQNAEIKPIAANSKETDNAKKLNSNAPEKANAKKENVSIHKMFAVKEATTKISTKVEEKVTAPSNSKQKKNGIAGFFSKQAASSPKLVDVSTKPTEKTSDIDKSNKNKVIQKSPKAEIKTERISPVKEVQSKSSPVNNSKKINGSKSSSDAKDTKKVNGSQKVKTYSKSSNKKESTKKRKRIQCVESDSDDGSGGEDNIFAPSPEPVKPEIFSDEDEDVIPPTPEAPKENPKAENQNSRKRKKLVDKTYMENGYILTVKNVAESCSEDDDVEMKENEGKSVVSEASKKVETSPKKTKKEITSPSKANSKSKSKKKVSPPSQGKQSSLTSFFKKT